MLPLEVCAYFEADPAMVLAGKLMQIFIPIISYMLLVTLCQCRQEVAYALENPEGLGTMFPMSGGEADGRGSIVPNPEGFSSA